MTPEQLELGKKLINERGRLCNKIAKTNEAINTLELENETACTHIRVVVPSNSQLSFDIDGSEWNKHILTEYCEMLQEQLNAIEKAFKDL